MVLYNVTVKVEKDSAEAWVRWMKEEHMPELMQTGLFADSRLYQLLDIDEEDGLTYAAQYFCNSMEDYNRYIAEHAPAMREKGLQRFKEKFIAFRTLMQAV
jgi:hypothetical protein